MAARPRLMRVAAHIPHRIALVLVLVLVLVLDVQTRLKFGSLVHGPYAVLVQKSIAIAVLVGAVSRPALFAAAVLA